MQEQEVIKILKEDLKFIDQSIDKLKMFEEELLKVNKKYNLKSFSAYECEWAYLNNERTWQHNKDSPILAKRDLKYSILTRFLRRQKKNLRRLFKLR